MPAGVPGTDGAAAATREAALAATQRVKIDTPSISGSINLTGGRIDDVRLKHYRLTVDKDSPEIELLNPSALPNGQYAELGFVGNEATGAVPGPETVWKAEGNQTLTPSTPVTLSYINPTRARPSSARSRSTATTCSRSPTPSPTPAPEPISLSSYGRVTRFDKPTTASVYVLHEGLIGVTGEEGLHELKYSAIEEDKQVTPSKSTDGWLGITDKYWAVALVPEGKQPFQPRFAYFEDGRPRYQSDFLSDPITVAPGQSQTVETLVFAGAKEVGKINAYEKDLRHPPVRPADRLGLVLLHHQADVLADRQRSTSCSAISGWPSSPRPSSSRPSSSRSPTSPTSRWRT